MIPYLYYPTQVVLLDDDNTFLSLLFDNLYESGFTYKTFCHPLTAFDFINNQTNASLINKHIEYNTTSFESTASRVNFSLLYEEIFNIERFNTTSIVVADYNMPNMNGIEFFKKIKNKKLKKILLTGEADEFIAVDAFNEGIIDRYIKKQSPNLPEILIEHLNILGNKFFIEKTNSFLDPMMDTKKYPFALFSNEFKKYFDKLIKHYQIVEYYLFEKMGSFVMLDANGKIYSLYTHNEDQAESFYLEIAALDNFIIPPSLKQKIKNRKKIFCYNLAQNTTLPPYNQWENHFQDCEQIGNENPFYCAFTEGFHGLPSIKDLKTYDYKGNGRSFTSFHQFSIREHL